MKLYNVKLTYHAVVVADNPEHAASVANKCRLGIARESLGPAVEVCRTVTGVDSLPHKWNGDDVPFGGDDVKTINEILEATKCP